MNHSEMVRGISVCNPIKLDYDVMNYAADYAIRNGINHYQINGPIHDPVRGNIDGMVFYRKYAQFNGEKDAAYVEYCMKTANAICEKLSAAGIKSYMWHHELEVPAGFIEAYPEICNEFGDVEVTHPRIRDFLENKISDFFAAYPKMDGIVLTLHETRIPLLKLKNQKLDKIGRVQYVTKILFDSCRALGKELIVRPFASIAQDYAMMTRAYEQISPDLIIMDKWTQFDWSLTLPPNAFFEKIKKNPLLVETDIFGEYFGQGQLPVMLEKHITDNFSYSMNYQPMGFVNRLDRAGHNAFGEINEVNYEIMMACMDGRNVSDAIDAFFASRYGKAAREIRSIMERTEDLQRNIFYLNRYYFTQGSTFPSWNHCKNHFFTEVMREDYCLASDEWFIPHDWEKGRTEDLLKEKETAVQECKALLQRVEELQNTLSAEQYAPLHEKFLNLFHTARVWQALAELIFHYSKYFETHDAAHEHEFAEAIEHLRTAKADADRALGERFYVNYLCSDQLGQDQSKKNVVELLIHDAETDFAGEKRMRVPLDAEPLTDYVLCGSGSESHKLKKEVNFSDTCFREGCICRIPGTYRGKAFSTVNTHGWFSYEVKIKPDCVNCISVEASGTDGVIDFSVQIGDETFRVHEQADGKKVFRFDYTETQGNSSVRVRIDRISGYTPFIYVIRSAEKTE